MALTGRHFLAEHFDILFAIFWTCGLKVRPIQSLYSFSVKSFYSRNLVEPICTRAGLHTDTDLGAHGHGDSHVGATSVLTHDDVIRRPERLSDDGAADLGLAGANRWHGSILRVEGYAWVGLAPPETHRSIVGVKDGGGPKQERITAVIYDAI